MAIIAITMSRVLAAIRAGIAVALSSATPSPLGSAAAGASSSASRADHVHAHPVIASGDLHSEYEREVEKNAASGYAGLDSTSRIALAQMWPGVLVAAGLCGDGSDGAVDFDGTNTYAAFASTMGAAPNLVYTLTRDVYATTIDIRASISVRTAGFIVHHTGLFTNRGELHNNGEPAVAGTAGAHQGVEGTIQSVRAGGGNGAATVGAQTINGATGTASGGKNVTGLNGGNGGAAGGAAGGVAGGGNAPTAIQGGIQGANYAVRARLMDNAGANGGGGGGGGGATSTTGTATGGGGGQSGGGVKVIGHSYDGAGGTISANGGTGAAASNTGDGVAGGGGGGAGGFLHLWFGLVVAWGTETTTAGAAGAGANGGSAGAAGGAGKIVKIVASS